MNKPSALFAIMLLAGATALLLPSCINPKNKEAIMVFSPDSTLQVKCRISDSLSGRFQYSVWFRDKEIILPSGLEIYPAGNIPIRDNLKITGIQKNATNESWERVWGKRKKVTNRYSQLILELKESVKPERLVNIHIRVYNDGVALRYELPVQKGLDTVVLARDRVEFRFAGDHTAWATFWNTFKSSQEKEFVRSKLSDIKKDNIIGTPLLVEAGNKIWMALMEANITDWACSGLSADPGLKNALVSVPSPLPGDTSISVRTLHQRVSPWKVMMIASSPGALIESDILQNLNEPCAVDDVSWIRPGISSWDWWWSGRYAPRAGFKPGPDTRTMKYYIDFAAEMGWQYQLVDWQWYGPPFREDGSFNTDADITKMNPDIDIPDLVKYAEARNVKIIIWLLWANVNRQMEEAFALYAKWGVAGVKIDFMDRNDQEMVNFYHRVAETAARHHLVVDFHGAYVPDGFSRTYPNLITREGVLGNEYNKWSDRVTPEHCLTIPFTRMLAGEMDFTPGGFLNDQPARFKIVGSDNPAPHVMGTRCFQLAMMVVYESAFGVFCESPDNVRNQAGSDFLKGIPSSWDETRVLLGIPGELIVIARRSGDRWYLGGMSLNARVISFKPGFLDDRKYTAVTWCDAPDAGINPRKVKSETRAADKQTEMGFNLSSNGGFTAILVPMGK